jgi:hypothetical protein
MGLLCRENRDAGFEETRDKKGCDERDQGNHERVVDQDLNQPVSPQVGSAQNI